MNPPTTTQADRWADESEFQRGYSRGYASGRRRGTSDSMGRITELSETLQLARTYLPNMHLIHANNILVLEQARRNLAEWNKEIQDSYDYSI